MSDIARYRDLVETLWETADIPPPPLTNQDILNRKKDREYSKQIQKNWQEREALRVKGPTRKSNTEPTRYTKLSWTIWRSFPNDEGEHQEIDIIVEVSGVYTKGEKATKTDPGWPSGFYDLELEWAEIDTNNPDVPPLTMAEKIALQKEFDDNRSSLHSYAEQALLDEYNDE